MAESEPLLKASVKRKLKLFRNIVFKISQVTVAETFIIVYSLTFGGMTVDYYGPLKKDFASDCLMRLEDTLLWREKYGG